MMLVLLIVAFWIAGLLLVAALCTAARRGEEVLARAAAFAEVPAAELQPVRAEEPDAPPVRIAA